MIRMHPSMLSFQIMLLLLCCGSVFSSENLLVQEEYEVHQSPDVASQYKTYPYPPVDLSASGIARQAAAPTVLQSPSHLVEISHYLFRGRLNFCGKLRFLIAGGGTGHKTEQLVRQLEDAGNTLYEVVHLDLSEASVKVAKRRIEAWWPAAVRESRVSFLTGSLLDVKNMDIGMFDYIDCLGVLHHLKDPSVGLRALKSVLKDDGGIAFMVYGELGRIGVYHMQRMIKLLKEDQAQLSEWPRSRQIINVTRRLLANLPSTNWLKIDRWRWGKLLQSVNGTGESGIVDMFIPAHDVPMRVPDVYAMADAAEMEIVQFVHPALYKPETYIHDPIMLEELQKLSGRREREEFAELLSGNHFHHFAYARKLRKHVNADSSIASINDVNGWDLTPIALRFRGADVARVIREKKLKFLPWKTKNLQVFFQLPALAADILENINGKNSVNTIYKILSSKATSLPSQKLSRKEFESAFHKVQSIMTGTGRLFLSNSLVNYGNASKEERVITRTLYPSSPEWGYYILPRCNKV